MLKTNSLFYDNFSAVLEVVFTYDLTHKMKEKKILRKITFFQVQEAVTVLQAHQEKQSVKKDGPSQ